MVSCVIRSTALLALLAGLTPVPVLALTVPVIVECRDCPAAGPVTATLRWGSEASVEAGETSEPSAGSVEISIPGTVEIDLLPSVLWSMKIFAQGWWSPEAQVFVQPPPQEVEPVRLSVSPAGEVEGWARMEDGSPVSDLSLGLAETPGDGKRGPTDLTSEATASGCELQDDGRFRCQVPAGLLDLRLCVSGAASEFRWGVPVGRREVVSLGEIRFVAGASLVGFLTAEGALHLPSSAWVELSPLTAAPAGSSAELRLQRLAQTVLPDVRGLFRFQDLRAGTYRLVVGAEGFVETSLSPIQVLEGRESMLREPLSLRRPARVEIWLSPPTDLEGRPWRLRLNPREDPRGGVLKPRTGLASVEGRWLQTDLRPGLYDLSVESGDHGRWHQEEVEVTGPETSLEIRLPLVEVTGRVVQDDEPIASLLIFGGRQGSRQVWLRSDEEGDFHGVLPREGEWPLEVVTHEDGTVQELDPVQVVKSQDGSPTALEIEIPDTRLKGKVVDLEDKPVAGALVTARRTDRASSLASDAKTGADGEFTFRGLSAGSYRVSARRLDPTRPLGLDAESPGVDVAVREGRALREVELVLEGRKTVRGVVLSSLGPVAGALVTIRPWTVRPATSVLIDDRVTGPTGEVQADVPGSTTGVTVVVDPPGFPTSFGYVPVAGDGSENLRFQVAETGGSLVVVMPQAVQKTWQGSPILHHAGSWVPLPALDARGRHETLTDPDLGLVDRWTHPSMAFGAYALCPTATLDERCATGYLQPEGELVLTPVFGGRGK